MARPVVIRTNYRDDAAYMFRLEAAVLKDDRRPTDWRNKIAVKCRELGNDLLASVQPVVAEEETERK